MVPHHFVYQLALCVLVWLFVMLHVTWSKPGLTTPPVPAQPKHKRSSASGTARSHAPDQPPPPDSGHLDALLSPHRL